MLKTTTEKAAVPIKSSKTNTQYKSTHKIRFITAASLFDGHDAAINMIRRLLQDNGVEVIHLGHNRSVNEVITAALQEDVQGIAISSYQGGHIEYFQYMFDLLQKYGADIIKIFGGGGGVIIPEEIKKLHQYGITRIYSPEDGATLGLQGMIIDMLEKSDYSTIDNFSFEEFNNIDSSKFSDQYKIAKILTAIENGTSDEKVKFKERLKKIPLPKRQLPVIGITGTGGAGKSSFYR